MNKYKKIIIFAVSFIVIAISDLIIFSGFFSRILVEKYTWILNNTILSLLLFFWMFIGLPSLVAYFIAFVLLKSKTTEENEITNKFHEYFLENKQIKLAIVATLFLGVIVMVFIRWATKPRFLPYTFHDILPGELVETTPTIPSPLITPSETFSSPSPTGKLYITPTLAPKPIATPTPLPTNTPTPTPTPIPAPPDTTPPTFSQFTGPADGGVYDYKNFCFPMHLTDNAPGEIQVRHKFDNEGWSTWGTNYNPCYSNVEDGVHSFSAQGKDAAGNETGVITRTFTIQAE